MRPNVFRPELKLELRFTLPLKLAGFELRWLPLAPFLDTAEKEMFSQMKKFAEILY